MDMDSASQVARRATRSLNLYVQAGPQGVSLLCFFVGLLATAVGAVEVFTSLLFDPETLLLAPFTLVMNCYMTLSGIVTVLIMRSIILNYLNFVFHD